MEHGPGSHNLLGGAGHRASLSSLDTSMNASVSSNSGVAQSQGPAGFGPRRQLSMFLDISDGDLDADAGPSIVFEGSYSFHEGDVVPCRSQRSSIMLAMPLGGATATAAAAAAAAAAASVESGGSLNPGLEVDVESDADDMSRASAASQQLLFDDVNNSNSNSNGGGAGAESGSGLAHPNSSTTSGCMGRSPGLQPMRKAIMSLRLPSDASPLQVTPRTRQRETARAFKLVVLNLGNDDATDATVDLEADRLLHEGTAASSRLLLKGDAASTSSSLSSSSSSSAFDGDKTTSASGPPTLAGAARLLLQRSLESGKLFPNGASASASAAAAAADDDADADADIESRAGTDRTNVSFMRERGMTRRNGGSGRGGGDNADEPDFESKDAKLRYYLGQCTQLTDFLYVGGRNVAVDKQLLLSHGITHVVNCAADICPNAFPESFSYMRLFLLDSGSEDILAVIYDAIEFIERARRSSPRAKIFVHCQQGVSRSAVVCIAYLMLYFNLPTQEAVTYVRKRRGITRPNFSFTCQLLNWSARLQGYQAAQALLIQQRQQEGQEQQRQQQQLQQHSFSASSSSSPTPPVIHMVRVAPHNSRDPGYLVPHWVEPSSFTHSSASDPSSIQVPVAVLDPRGVFVLAEPGSLIIAIGSTCADPLAYLTSAARYALRLLEFESAASTVGLVVFDDARPPAFARRTVVDVGSKGGEGDSKTSSSGNDANEPIHSVARVADPQWIANRFWSIFSQTRLAETVFPNPKYDDDYTASSTSSSSSLALSKPLSNTEANGMSEPTSAVPAIVSVSDLRQRMLEVLRSPFLHVGAPRTQPLASSPFLAWSIQNGDAFVSRNPADSRVAAAAAAAASTDTPAATTTIASARETSDRPDRGRAAPRQETMQAIMSDVSVTEGSSLPSTLRSDFATLPSPSLSNPSSSPHLSLTSMSPNSQSLLPPLTGSVTVSASSSSRLTSPLASPLGAFEALATMQDAEYSSRGGGGAGTTMSGARTPRNRGGAPPFGRASGAVTHRGAVSSASASKAFNDANARVEDQQQLQQGGVDEDAIERLTREAVRLYEAPNFDHPLTLFDSDDLQPDRIFVLYVRQDLWRQAHLANGMDDGEDHDDVGDYDTDERKQRHKGNVSDDDEDPTMDESDSPDKSNDVLFVWIGGDVRVVTGCNSSRDADNFEEDHEEEGYADAVAEEAVEGFCQRSGLDRRNVRVHIEHEGEESDEFFEYFVNG